ncbi:oxalurate catabolism protein HpxX [Pseudescherichia sp.]|uniref:oxalurate catabolism protein HpxX n=1 Tax=Pseudescherichia sp. TaxID=2055881 RepID=UPI00289CF722|nr:oxalurate catabolism protein HpxX [Pseudescherichia sp.]
MSNAQSDWATYLAQMTQLLDLELDDARRAELEMQFSRIAAMAEPLMAFPLDDRLEIAGVYKA